MIFYTKLHLDESKKCSKRIFGSPDVFRLRKEPINSLSYVLSSVGPFVWPFLSYSLDRSIFFGLSALAVEAYGFLLVRASVRACVRACVRARRDIWRSAHQILMMFCTKLHLDESKKCSKRIFERNGQHQMKALFLTNTLHLS